MISQAWQRHRKDQLAVSVSTKQLHEAMLVEETSSFLNDTFVAQLVMPDLSFAEVYADTEPVLQQARIRGHRAVEPLSLKSGWTFSFLPVALWRSLTCAAPSPTWWSSPFLAAPGRPCSSSPPSRPSSQRKERRRGYSSTSLLRWPNFS